MAQVKLVKNRLLEREANMANLIPQGGVFAGLDRLNQALDQRAQNAMALSQMQENQRRNALVEGYAAEDRARQLQEIKRQEMIRNAMSQPYTQQTGGPLLSQMGQDYQPVSLETMQPTRELVGQRLQGLGEWEQALKLMPEVKTPEGFTLGQGDIRFSGNGQVLARGGEKPASLPEYKEREIPVGGDLFRKEQLLPDGSWKPIGEPFKKSGGVNVTIGDKRENKLLDQFASDLPKARTEAVNAARNISRLDQAIGITEKYGNSVTGMGGAMQKAMGSVLAPLGLNTAKMDAAQILDSLTKEGAGSLRAAIIGPGQVSNYEQQIMQQVSGGRMSSADGVLAILEHHRKTSEGMVDDYQKTLDTFSGEEGYQKAKELYPAPKYSKRKYKTVTEAAGPQSAGIKFLGFE